MASETPEERTASEAATEFADGYYTALNCERKSLDNFYLPLNAKEDGVKEPLIVWNGHIIDDPVEYRKTMDLDFGFVHFHHQSVDCQVISTGYYTDKSSKPSKPEENISFVVMTTGYVRTQERTSGPMMEFCENFVLVPNPSRSAKGGIPRKRFLIQNQVFRWIFSHENAEPDKEMELE